MKKYKIEILETLSKIIEVKADSYHEAFLKVQSDYQNSVHVLDSNDFVSMTYNDVTEYSEQDKLIKFFDDNGFSVHLFKQDKKQCAELEIWTTGGVDMIITLMPFSKKEFIGWVDSFDIDEEITIHRQAKDYCSAFTLRQSLEDFEEFIIKLGTIVEKLENELI
jgi:hypothetical protein